MEIEGGFGWKVSEESYQRRGTETSWVCTSEGRTRGEFEGRNEVLGGVKRGWIEGDVEHKVRVSGGKVMSFAVLYCKG